MAARASASISRLRSDSRLSCSFLPLATANSSLMRPFLRYILVGISVSPFSRVFSNSLSISWRCSSSLRRRVGSWFSRFPWEYWLICALSSQASFPATSAKLSKLDFAVLSGLHFGSGEGQTGLKPLQQVVVMAGLAVVAQDFDFRLHGLPAY